MDNRLKLLKERPEPPQMARNQSWINLVEVHGSLVDDESRCHSHGIICRKRSEITSNFHRLPVIPECFPTRVDSKMTLDRTSRKK